MDEKDTAPTDNKILQEPAEGDRATIDRELERKDGGNAAHHEDDKDHDIHETVRKAMDEAAPQTGVRPGP
ncbi:hypothetical protein C8J38_101491 [Rhizobium sp. PP-WC-2G-219]|uniref:Uncharacterized protein n=1 Tax=Ferranicluibacter rubi TaxID=2715133 RepID=A0AA43ZCK1_9HYPH|nr:hypothetical protein [Ferranicluibacter rubi]NHT74407.1 hypothetical protein [Ferranicluibacter rubi]PYE46695.1 hypothetical protein DFI02_101841 [Rhizobium sp. PP-F2F-G20b]TCL96136.1 hypothetical protein C8J38_101491 [Rhizobium sp. PP-WC-2G-219]